jgi:hypothetical protein
LRRFAGFYFDRAFDTMKNMNNIKLKEWLRKTGGETPL